MLQTRQFIIASFVLLFGMGFGLFLSGIIRVPVTPIDYSNEPILIPLNTREIEFKHAVETIVQTKKGSHVDGYTPSILLEVFPALAAVDFSGVSAVIGQYEYKNEQLSYINSDVVDAAADDISDEGYRRLQANVYSRLAIGTDTPAAEVIRLLQISAATSTEPIDNSEIPPTTNTGTACTKEAKICSDGSSVGRTGLQCEFAACPVTNDNSQTVVCADDQRLVDVCTEQYAPVCADYQVQCITTPCNPVPRTYSNSCFACQNKNVISYKPGECSVN